VPLLAGLAAAPVGALIAIPAIRLSGVYLGLVTLGFAIFMQDVIYPTGSMFGKKVYVAVGRPRLGPIHGASDRTFYFVALLIAVVVGVVLTGVRRGQLGRLLRAMAETPTMLATNGLSVNLTKVIVFALSAALAGVGGGLVVTQFGQVSGDPFGPVQSLVLVAVLGICGTRLIGSAVIAAILFSLLPGYVTSFNTDRQLLLFGIAAVIGGLVLASRRPIADRIEQLGVESESRRRHGPIAARNQDVLAR
jgi:ABC-type branched-subunit amino acid transport system permease subunit